MPKQLVRHKVTRKTKTGKTITYFRGHGAPHPDEKGGKNPAGKELADKKGAAQEESPVVGQYFAKLHKLYMDNHDDVADMQNMVKALDKLKAKVNADIKKFSRL